MQEEREVEPEATPEPAPEYEVTAKDVEAGVCPECHGASGHHTMNCEYLKNDGVDDVDLELSEESLEELEVEIPDKLPPTADDLASNDMVWLIAKCCHEVNRQFCAGIAGDFSHAPWDDTPTWQRESVYNGVRNYLDNPNLTPEQSHAAWMKYKLLEGWRYGNTKDERAKTHPNLIPFAQLHVQERTKDAIFVAICKTMLGD